ncbi:hypothetical protein GCM10017600_79210 [Streptosporangium carneum]|uniref:Uncharacterized protein n=1 Tax=Streptosporangium carneum TaxID=47481 RepID=A0A9W6IBG2_9ACTN|nr:hypothetical protein GCM10017600_79210 [Streptosporangium carneum]
MADGLGLWQRAGKPRARRTEKGPPARRQGPPTPRPAHGKTPRPEKGRVPHENRAGPVFTPGARKTEKGWPGWGHPFGVGSQRSDAPGSSAVGQLWPLGDQPRSDKPQKRVTQA